MDVKKIYSAMHREYGSQGWWPLSKGRLQTNHHCGPPKDSHDQWEIIVGACLTQNTSWSNVEKAIENLNRAELLRIENIIKAPESRIAELIRPAGYFNQKAERLKLIADYFSEHFRDRTVPSRDDLLAVKGIGPETADSILLYAFGQPYFVVDAYTRRIFSRLGL
ncbi:endonuclease III domain-containing protein, partial [Candidatus Woesearchaeota archaeon]|nr:endonuclease III domain-containing protein [Candidatus Woesearchaeota archaeon]